MRGQPQTSNSPNSSVNADMSVDAEQGGMAEHVEQNPSQVEIMAHQLQLLQQELYHLRGQVNENQERKSRDEEDLPAIMEELIPAHMNLLRTLPEEERKKLLRNVPKYHGIEPITDKNGLAAKGMQNDKKKLVTKDLVNFQRDNIDVFRLATSAAVNLENGGQDAVQKAGDALVAIARVAMDNAQKAATLQLQYCMEHAKASGADYLINYSVDNDKFSVEDRNIFQQAHLDAVKEFKRFTTQVEKAQTPATKTATSRSSYRGGRGRGGSGYNSYNSYNRYNNNRGYNKGSRGYGSFRGGGGRGGNNNQSQQEGK